MPQEATLDPTRQTATSRKAQASAVGRNDQPAKTQSFYGLDTSQPFEVQDPSKAAPQTRTGRRGAQRAFAREMQQRRGQKPKRPEWYERWFEFPPAFEHHMRRQVAFFRRSLSPHTVFEPLPAPLKQSFTRNLDFLGRSLTQLFHPGDAKQSLGLGR